MYLLLNKLSPNVINKFGETPIFFAAEQGNLDVLNILSKDKRVNLEHQDKFGDCLLHFAARDGQLEICDYLMKKNKRLGKIKNQEGKTPLTYAIENSQSSVA
jgi:ankyrin repeat protein